MQTCVTCGDGYEGPACPRCEPPSEASSVAPLPALAPADVPATEKDGAPEGAPMGAATGVTNEPVEGEVFAGRYRIERLIGKGGMGAVYEAVQLSMSRKVALKVMLATPEDTTALRRFEREARASSLLEPPNTIRVYDSGVDAGRPFLAMELLSGEPLGRILRRERRLAPERVVRIGLQIAKSLGEAHAAGLVHRDLKPDNVFLSELFGEFDHVKVLDLGIARFTQKDQVTAPITLRGMTLGTVDYMSPEQVASETLDGRSDLFALGVVLFQCLTGALPFPSARTMSARSTRSS